MTTPIAAALGDLAKAIRTERARASDGEVWLSIYNSVASCPNADRATAIRWADSGLEEYKSRFPVKEV